MATFQKDTVLPEGILFRQRRDTMQSFFEGVGSHFDRRPLRCAGAGRDGEPRQDFRLPSGGRQPTNRPCAEKIISNLAHRAYRRPIAADDLPPLLALYKQGAETGGFEAGMRLALQKILVSPEFIFRDRARSAGYGARMAFTGSATSSSHRGLSFFLWSSIPDDELLAVAERGELSDPAVLEDRSGACWPIRAHRRW